jgi:ribosomal-protein-alanine N-acetyltransferase
METKRLHIRKAKPTDFDDYIKMRNSEFVLKYNAMKVLKDEEVKQELLKYSQSQEVLFLEEKALGKVIGAVFLQPDSLRYQVDAVMLSYYLNEEYAAKGYMSEALKAIIDHLFNEKKAEVVSARVFSDNIPSQKLLQKLGFVKEGCIRRCVKGYRDVVHDDMLFSILKEEYKQ